MTPCPQRQCRREPDTGTGFQISICRDGPAANSLRTLAVDVRILIVLD